jgi:hypothetical protein
MNLIDNAHEQAHPSPVLANTKGCHGLNIQYQYSNPDLKEGRLPEDNNPI